MSKEKSKEICNHPDKLKGKPGECSPEQIRECHGEIEKHPCVKAKQLQELKLLIYKYSLAQYWLVEL